MVNGELHRLNCLPSVYTVILILQIARDWNLKQDGGGYVTRFEIDADFVQRYPIHTVGSSIHRELWVPADELAEFNRNIVGVIEVIASFPPSTS